MTAFTFITLEGTLLEFHSHSLCLCQRNFQALGIFPSLINEYIKVSKKNLGSFNWGSRKMELIPPLPFTSPGSDGHEELPVVSRQLNGKTVCKSQSLLMTIQRKEVN